MHPSAVMRGSNLPGFDPKLIPGLTRWAQAVHAEGALLIGQINHSGRQHNATTVPGRLIGPSAIACPRSGGVPHAMSDAEIKDFIKHVVQAGRNMAEAGLDGIEVHCAQGHLLQQFLSPFSNRRTDQWGGCLGQPAAFRARVSSSACARRRRRISPSASVSASTNSPTAAGRWR